MPMLACKVCMQEGEGKVWRGRLMDVLVTPGTFMQSGAQLNDGACDALDVEELTAHLAAIGRVTGEYGEDEAMILAGRVVVILSYRQFLRAYPIIEFSAVVHQVLVLADYPAAAQTYVHLESGDRKKKATQVDGDEVPMVVHRSGRCTLFEPNVLASSLCAASHAFSEYDDDEALVLAGDITKVLGLRLEPCAPITTAELEEMVENLLIDKGHIMTARGIFCKMQNKGNPEPIEEAVGSFLSLLEKAA